MIASDAQIDEVVSWIQRHYEAAKISCPFDFEDDDDHRRCVATLLALGRFYNLQTASYQFCESLDVWPGGMRVYLARGVDLGSFDGSEMTKLVVASHYFCTRSAVSAWSVTAEGMWDKPEIRPNEWRMLMLNRHTLVRDGIRPASHLWPFTVTGLQLTITARQPGSNRLFDRHPSLDDLVKRIQEIDS